MRIEELREYEEEAREIRRKKGELGLYKLTIS
jgi:hypothetical protein